LTSALPSPCGIFNIKWKPYNWYTDLQQTSEYIAEMGTIRLSHKPPFTIAKYVSRLKCINCKFLETFPNKQLRESMWALGPYFLRRSQTAHRSHDRSAMSACVTAGQRGNNASDCGNLVHFICVISVNETLRTVILFFIDNPIIYKFIFGRSTYRQNCCCMQPASPALYRRNTQP
jgi:hypothetical protein